MSPEEFKAFQPRTQDEVIGHEKELEFRDWCEENEEDPLDDGARDRYNERQEESGDKGWDNMDENDRAGWKDNINKD